MTAVAVPGSSIGDLETAVGVEWLETNGRGGYSSSTAAGTHTRRVHGLLAVRPDGREEPVILLSKLEEAVVVGGGTRNLSCGVFSDAIHPPDPLLPSEFRQDPFPRFVYRDDSFELQKTVFMPHGENAVVVHYELVRSDRPVFLEIRPLVTARSAFALARESAEGGAPPAEYGNRLVFRPSLELPAFQLAHSGARLLPSAHWYRSYVYPADDPPGRSEVEDLFNPCTLQFELAAGGRVWLTASTRLSEVYAETVDGWTELERYRRQGLRPVGRRARRSDLDPQLLLAADSFLVRRDEWGPVIVQGFPDASVSTGASLQALPGLLLATGRISDARRVLMHIASLCRDGLLPETIQGPPRYETSRAETALWFVHAVERYLKHTGDMDTVRQSLYPAVKMIVSALLAGLHAGGVIGPDGLLTVSTSDGSRSSRPVEAQALWYNGLGVATFLAHNIESARAARDFSLAARRCHQSFQEQYWNAPDGCLYDSVVHGVADTVLRPQQVLVAAFPDSPIDRRQRELVVTRVRDALLAPMGLRDPDVPGRVVPSWIGPYATACTLVHGRNPRTRSHVEQILSPLLEFFTGRGAGRVPAVFDNDSPGGRIADAVATAELLRAHYELAGA